MESSAESGEEPHARIRQQEVVAELGQQALETGDIDQLMTMRRLSLRTRWTTTTAKFSNYCLMGTKSFSARALAGVRDWLEMQRSPLIWTLRRGIHYCLKNRLSSTICAPKTAFPVLNSFLLTTSSAGSASSSALLIEGLLEYSRVETAGEPLERVDLDAVLEDVHENLHVRIEESDAQITMDSLPCIKGDEGQLRQVFQNLLSNAIEYSGDEPPQVHVTAERNGTEWTVAVSDEGVGIDPDDQERIFEVFQRGDSTEESSGTGIGLALCERIIERHGSDIGLESDPGEGATFSFTLPAVQEESDD